MRCWSVPALTQPSPSFPSPLRPPAAQLESLSKLQPMLVGFRQWEAGMRALLQGGSGGKRPGFSAVSAASVAARSWPITSPLRALADDAVARTGGLRERACSGWGRSRGERGKRMHYISSSPS